MQKMVFTLALIASLIGMPAHAFKVGGMNWISSDGTANQCLKTDGLGNLGWEPVVRPTDLSATAPLSYNSATELFSMPVCTASQDGYLSHSDWSLFNAKQNALTFGNLTSPTAGVSITGGTSAVIGSGAALSIQNATTAQPGLLTASDWNTFNGKQNAGNYLTALTGDVSASGPGSASATVNLVGGSTAANIHAAELAANGAVSTNTASKIVIRDGSGNFSAGTITASLAGNATSATTASALSGNINPSQINQASASTNQALVWNGTAWAPGSVGGGALSVTGSPASPQNITAAGGIAFTGAQSRTLWFVQGSGGPVTVTANPQIAAATTVGQELVVVGGSDTNNLTLNDGAGLSLNGPMTFYKNTMLYLISDGSNWVENDRRN